MYDIEQLRQEEFPHSAEIVYLNHAGISPLPQRTKRAVQEVVEALSRDPGDFFGSHALPAFETLQGSLASYLNAASPAEIVPITSTSAGLNMIAQAIDWPSGSNVIFCDLEFPSNAYPWMSLVRDGVEPRCVPADRGGLTLARLEEFVDERTSAVAVSAVQFFSGHKTDLAAIGRFCHERNILLIVDAIQAIGHKRFDVEAMHIDVLATGGMKSLLALPGAGFMYVRQAVAENARPRTICANATVDYLHWLDYDLTPLPGSARFSSGTPNVAGMLAILPSLRLITELGVDAIDKHTTALTRYAGERLAAEGYEVITPLDAAGPIVTLRSPWPNEETDRLIAYLAGRRIAVVKHLDKAGAPYIRLSFHCYNTRAEVDTFMAAVREFVN
jgi:selenocysteine lyase/cysteine desulfurase